MAEERREATSLDSEEGKEMSCPKCGFDEVAHQEKKDAKILRLQQWLDSEDAGNWGADGQVRDILTLLLKMYRDSDEIESDGQYWASICAMLKCHPNSPVR